MTSLYDNTRISAYRRCPRYYFFRHVLDMITDYDGESVKGALPLAFGGAWHESMDVVWGMAASDKSDHDLGLHAYAAFVNKWKEWDLPDPDQMGIDEQEAFTPRTPGVAAEMISEYIKQRRPFLKKLEILNIERPFAVPLDQHRPDLFYVGRRDKDFRQEDGGIYTGEHKTTTWYAKATGFRDEWVQSFSPNSQVEGYIHSGHMDYGNDFKAVWVDGALVHKQVHDKFKFLPISRNLSRMEEWRQDTLQWVEDIETDLLRWKAGQPAFRRNTDSCFSYGKPCPFLDLCRFHEKPLEIDRDNPPEGFRTEHWSPFDELGLAELGLEAEDEQK